MILKKTLAALAASFVASLVHADVNVGVTVSATGPAASATNCTPRPTGRARLA